MTFSECLSKWFDIILCFVMMVILAFMGFAIIYLSCGWILLIPVFVLVPPTICYIWNNYIRKSK